MAKKILFVVGSLREKSFNRQLAHAIEPLVAGRADVSLLEYADVPFMNQDAENPVPAAVDRVRRVVQETDGIWFCTAEYNFAVPGVLKNLLDWLSRPLVAGDFASGTAAMGKKATISGVGGKNATRNSRADLKKLLELMRMDVVAGEGTGVAVGAEAFLTDVLTLDDTTVAALQKQADEFLAAL